MGVGLAAAVALLAGEVWGEERFDQITSQPGALVLALILGGTALGATAATFQRVPAAFAIAVFAVLPLRLPIQIGGETNFLLIPLYGVIAGGFLRGLWLCLAAARGRAADRERAHAGTSRPRCATSRSRLPSRSSSTRSASAWSDNPTNAVRTVAFFLAPFASMLALLRDVRWHRKLVGQVLLASVIVALGFARPRAMAVRDARPSPQQGLKGREPAPPLLPRQLALPRPERPGPLSGARRRSASARGSRGSDRGARRSLGSWRRRCCSRRSPSPTRRPASSALAVGLGLLVWFRFGMRGFALAAALGGERPASSSSSAGPSADESVDKDRTDLAEASSGRTNLISGGIDLFQDAPIAGQGSGSFATSYRREVDKVRKPVSHTEPITVAAEQGIIGLIPYFAVLALAARRPLPARGLRETTPAPGSRPPSRRSSCTRSATRALRSTRRCGRCSRWVLRCGSERPNDTCFFRT